MATFISTNLTGTRSIIRLTGGQYVATTLDIEPRYAGLGEAESVKLEYRYCDKWGNTYGRDNCAECGEIWDTAREAYERSKVKIMKGRATRQYRAILPACQEIVKSYETDYTVWIAAQMEKYRPTMFVAVVDSYGASMIIIDSHHRDYRGATNRADTAERLRAYIGVNDRSTYVIYNGGHITRFSNPRNALDLCSQLLQDASDSDSDYQLPDLPDQPMVYRHIAEFDDWRAGLGSLTSDEITQALETYERAISLLENNLPKQCEFKITLYLSPFQTPREYDSQVIAMGQVVYAIPELVEPTYNWYGQNLSCNRLTFGVVWDVKSRSFSIHT